jgi:hypothetical protein
MIKEFYYFSKNGFILNLKFCGFAASGDGYG